MERASVRTASPLFHLPCISSHTFMPYHSWRNPWGTAHYAADQEAEAQTALARTLRRDVQFPKSQAGGPPVAFSVVCHAAPTKTALKRKRFMYIFGYIGIPAKWGRLVISAHSHACISPMLNKNKTPVALFHPSSFQQVP